MGWESPSRWLIIAVVVIVLFGYKKLPDAARSVGRSLRIFKTEIKGMDEDDKAREQARKAGAVEVVKTQDASASGAAAPAKATEVPAEPARPAAEAPSTES